MTEVAEHVPPCSSFAEGAMTAQSILEDNPQVVSILLVDATQEVEDDEEGSLKDWVVVRVLGLGEAWYILSRGDHEISEDAAEDAEIEISGVPVRLDPTMPEDQFRMVPPDGGLLNTAHPIQRVPFRKKP